MDQKRVIRRVLFLAVVTIRLPTAPWNVLSIFFCFSDINQYVNDLTPKLLYITFKNSARTAKKTSHFAITKINLLTLFKK
jgi:hypothetical protein